LLKKFTAGSCIADKTKDYGMAAKYKMYRDKNVGGNEKTWKEMDKDTFYVTKMLDSHLHGANLPTTFLYEAMRMGDNWEYDPATIKCPTHIYNGRDEVTHVHCAELYHKLIPDSKLTVFEDHGHFYIGVEAEKIIKALLNGEIVPPSEQCK
jgi:pimeloyl-ACP methyl ester carboxylesterase